VVADELIVSIYAVRNPQKLKGVAEEQVLTRLR